ncbi:MAG: hypothetical protein ACI9UJ_002017 [bacterium]|jgi:hypothetical protein
MKTLIITMLTTIISTVCYGQIGWMATFESATLSKADTFWNGADLTGSFNSGNGTFKNNYDTAWKVWDGFGVSNMTDTVTANYTNQYSVVSGTGVNYTQQYAVVSHQSTVILDKQQVVKGCYINNATYPAISMKNGDGFAKKFGGTDGMDKDYFRIIATGHIGNSTTEEVFYLADYRDADASKDYILTDWKHWNLERLGDVDSIVFTLESSDTGQFGMNTPAFFCMDNFNSDSLQNSYTISDISFDYQTDVDSFENGSNHDGGFVNNGALFVNDYNKDWNSWTGWSLSSMTDTVNGSYANQYSSIAGSGFGRSKTYLTGYNEASILFPYIPETHFNSLRFREYWVSVNNTTYGYKTMKNGNQFAKKFGGTSGDDKDYFVLKVVGTYYSGEKTDTLEHYLADYRFDDNSQNFIQKDWMYWDIASIIDNQPVIRLNFWIEGSDTGQYGLNTPAYFCMDNIFPVFTSFHKTEKQVMNIYPNPTTDKINIDVASKIKEIKVIDLMGQNQMSVTGSNTIVDVSVLKSGIYFIQVETNTGLVTKQFIKE